MKTIFPCILVIGAIIMLLGGESLLNTILMIAAYALAYYTKMSCIG